MQVTKSLLLALLAFALTLGIQAQDQSGFISLDCGSPPDTNYNEVDTNIRYISDSKYIDTGIGKSIQPQYKDRFQKQASMLRSFPDGTRNCYTFNLTVGDEYLIIATFIYGNYDGLNVSTSFELHLGPNLWTKIELEVTEEGKTKEIIHVIKTSRLQICLVKTGTSVPFISSLELRRLKNTIYTATTGSLQKFSRLDLGSNDGFWFRFGEDVFDRLWGPYKTTAWTNINTSLTVNTEDSDYKPPQIGMQTAVIPADVTKPISFSFPYVDASTLYYVYMYFAEIQQLEANASREFNILYNGEVLHEPFSPSYLSVSVIYSTTSLTPLNERFELSLEKTKNSTLPPLLNAIEVYSVNLLPQSDTDQTEVEAMMNIKMMYGLKISSWQGDPCAPQAYTWNGLNCTHNLYDPPNINSLNLSSSGLTGEIAQYISNLNHLKVLDLSNNNLTGSIPRFLSGMKSLTSLNLSNNKLTGSVPNELLGRQKEGSIALSLDGNHGLCESCKKKKSFVIYVVASVASLLILAAVFATILFFKNKKPKNLEARGYVHVGPKISNASEITRTNRLFSYSEVLKMTNNFDKVLGRGGFGIVYHGNLGDTQVAVKILSQTSSQGYKEFKTEVELLLRVHHRNLTSLVGYCDEGDKMALIYELMANGDLRESLSGKRSSNVLSWEDRLHIAVASAQGLEYLHHGCKPPIVHRDVKSTNILLTEKLEAKLADFGLSRSFPLGGTAYVSTVVAGTPGYLDPDYYRTNWLTEKSDVYSFGIVILDLITNQPVIDQKRKKSHIGEWVELMLGEGDIRKIVDPRLQNNIDTNSVWKVAGIAMSCIRPSANERPSMTHVVSELNECLEEEIARRQGNKETDYLTDSDEMALNVPSQLNPGLR